MSFKKLFSPRLCRFVVFAASLVLLAGCATNRIDWNSRIGTFTYDQAVLELGPPDKTATLTDGTKVVEWLTSRGYSHGSIGMFYGPYFRGPYIHHYSEAPSPDYFIRLTFDPEGRLRDWRRVAK
jgi:hypothetical protein